MQNKVDRILSFVENKDIAAKLQEKLEAHETFTAMRIFEPNGRIHVGEALSFASTAKLVGELGGKLIVFIADISANMHRFYTPDTIVKITKFSVAVLKAAGCDGPHVEFYVANDHTPDDYDFFHQMIEFSMKISIDDIQKTLPPVGKGKCLQASDVLVPLMLATEALTKKVDIVFANPLQFPQLEVVKMIQGADLPQPVILLLPGIRKLRGPKANSPKPDIKDHFYFEDGPEIVANKCNGAYCTDAITENPTFDYIIGVILPFLGEFVFGEKKYTSKDEIIADFAELEKKTLKQTIGNYINDQIKRIAPLLDVPELAQIKPAIIKLPATQ